MGCFDPPETCSRSITARSHKAIDNSHHEWSVDFPPAQARSDLAEVDTGTELSGDNVTFDRIGCKRYEFNG